jgi:acetyl-CoA carboxylase alpha subunit
MLENSIYSILSPEGFASILWHDGSRWEEASELMKLTAGELQELGICDEVLAEPTFGSEAAKEYIFDALDRAIWRNLEPLLKRSGEDLVRKRYRELGGFIKVFRHPGGHHPHGLDDPTPLIDCILENVRYL